MLKCFHSKENLAKLGSVCARQINMLIMGPPGGGKGTISKKILKIYDFEHVASGDLLRREITEGSDLGRKAKQYMNDGKLVPDEVFIAQDFISSFTYYIMVP